MKFKKLLEDNQGKGVLIETMKDGVSTTFAGKVVKNRYIEDYWRVEATNGSVMFPLESVTMIFEMADVNISDTGYHLIIEIKP